MENKSVEYLARQYANEFFNSLAPKYTDTDIIEVDNLRACVETAFKIGLKVYQDARQDQGVVGTQGREEAIEEFIDKVYEYVDHKLGLKQMMRLNWPVSEGEGMNGWISVEDKLPDDSIAWCLVMVVEVNDLGISKYPWIAQYSKLHGWTNHDESFKVTHWQPVPSPPQNQK